MPHSHGCFRIAIDIRKCAMKKLEDINHFYEISDQLATADQPTQQDMVTIAKAGYQVVINLGLTDGEYALTNEEDIVKSLGMKYFHIPVIWENPTRKDLAAFFLTMDKYLNI